MNKPGQFYRITLDNMHEIPEISGVYVLAYMGRVVYVGKAVDCIQNRLRGHYTNALNEPFGAWLRRIEADWPNVRLDMLGIPEGDNTWLANAEAALIKCFDPLFNTQLVGS